MTVLLENIALLLLQLRVTRPASACRATVYTYKMAYFNHVDIAPLLKSFVKITPTCFFVVIKSAVLLWFTNPSKRSTFNVRLVSHKNFRTIAPTVFTVGVSTNRLKLLSTIAHIFLNSTANRTKFCGDTVYCKSKSFAVVEINCNLLENIHGCMVILYGQTLLHRLFHWKSFAVTNQSTKTAKLFHLEQFAIAIQYSF